MARLGHGTRIAVAKDGNLIFSEGIEITAETSIICVKKISIGSGALISWENLIMDTDFHKVLKHDEVLNHPQEITIGEHVWIGCRCTILKGGVIPNHTIVSAGSLLTKKFTRENTVIGGVPANVLRTDVDWLP